jgi:hypothetical protein
MLKRTALLLALGAASPALAAPTITEPTARAFVERQDRAWNAGDLKRFFATYGAGAVFVSQGRNSQGGVTLYGRSTVAEARAQARRTFARSKPRQQTIVDRVLIAPDRRSATVAGRQITRIETGGQVRTYCGETQQRLALANGRMVSQGQIDTAVRCRGVR